MLPEVNYFDNSQQLRRENRKGDPVSFLLHAKPFHAILFSKEIVICSNPQIPIAQRKIYRLKS